MECATISIALLPDARLSVGKARTAREAASLRVVEALTDEGFSLVPRPWCRRSGRRVYDAHRASELYSTATNIFFFLDRIPKLFSSAASAGFRRKGQVFGVVALRSQERDAPSFPLFSLHPRTRAAGAADARFCLHIPLQSPSLQSHRRASQARRTAGPSADGTAREGDGPGEPQPCQQAWGGKGENNTHARTALCTDPRRSAPPSPTSILARSFEPPPYSHDRAEPRVIGVDSPWTPLCRSAARPRLRQAQGRHARPRTPGARLPGARRPSPRQPHRSAALLLPQRIAAERQRAQWRLIGLAGIAIALGVEIAPS